MFVYYDETTLEPQHAIFVHDPSYDPKTNGANFVQHDDSSIPFERMMIAKAADGTVSIAAKQDMPIALLASPIKLGSDAMFLAVPAGASITINGVAQGIMDSTGSLDITPTTTGFYKVTFSLAGYMDWSETLEVVSGS